MPDNDTVSLPTAGPCQRCGHGPWIPRKLPVRICPKCKSDRWQQAPKWRKAAK